MIHPAPNFASRLKIMTEKERKEMEWWLGEFSAEDQAEKYLELFPEMNDRLWKYAVGIHIWAM